CAREYGRRGRSSSRYAHARAEGCLRPGSLNVGLVDLSAGGLSTLLAARLLAHVRAAQWRVVAAAYGDARGWYRRCSVRAVASTSPRTLDRARSSRPLGLRGLGLPVESVCDHQLG